MSQVNNLKIINLKDLKTLVSDLSFNVNYGDKIAIIGEEGAGKSSILKFIMNFKYLNDYLKIEGSISNSFVTGYLPQTIDEKDLELKIEEFIGEINYENFYTLLKELNLDNDFIYRNYKIKNLSGGEKIKISLLKILMNDPELLLLDEPSNDLDIETLYWLESFIKKSNRAILFISHDTELLKETANGIIHIGKKSSFVPISYEEYVNRLNNKFINDLRIANKERAEYDKKMQKFRRIYQKVDHAQKQVVRDPETGRLLAKKMHAVLSMKKRFERESKNFTDIPEREESIFIKFSNYTPLPNSKPIFNLKNYELKIADKILSKNINLDFYGQDKIGIIGKNGVGKTSLFRKIYDMLKGRNDINLGIMPQNYDEILDFNKSALEFMTEIEDKEERTKIMTYLSSMKFSIEEINRKMSDLSPGQQAKIILTKMDLTGVNVMLLDEPTRNFSPLSIDELNKVFSEYNGAILAISHDRSFLSNVTNKIYELKSDGLFEI